MPDTQLYVGAVVLNGDEVLLVRQSAGHPLGGLWTVPWGRVESGESPADAALREVMEEGGVSAVIEGLLGVQELPSPWKGGVALVYLCRHLSGVPAPQDAEVDASQYVSAASFASLAETTEPWTRWLLPRIWSGAYSVVLSDQSNPLQSHGSYL